MHGPTRIPRHRNATRIAAITTVLALMTPGLHAAPRSPNDACSLRVIPEHDRLVHVPFETVDGRIYVQARVNGQGPFRFAVDTGASGLARADATLASALGLTVQGQANNSDGVQTAQADTTRLQSLQLDRLERRDIEVITRDYSSRSAPAAAFAGIIAREFFADGLLVIDYPSRTLTFTRAVALPVDGMNVLPYERAFRIPVSIGALHTTGNLDTGANVAFVLPQSLYDKVASAVQEKAGDGHLANGSIETRRATVRGPFVVGGASLRDVEVRVSDRFPELLVGAHALQNTAVLIDQRAKRVAVCADAAVPD